MFSFTLGNFPANVDLETRVRGGREAVCGQKVPLIDRQQRSAASRTPNNVSSLIFYCGLRNTQGRLLFLTI